MSTALPQVFGDRYELVRHIARGGMAQVYLARDALLDRQVALKVLFPELSVDPSFVERFRAEAKAAANLSHPNIVAVFDWGQGERTYFIVMEYVDGATLSSELRAGRMAPSRAAEIGADVAGALEFAHRRGVIHRDVKPGNVLIDTSGQVKVADFGIARAVGAKEGLTQTGAVMGTATYFSPEQAQGLPVDARSDVYSLGVVLFEMVAGRPPFTGDNPVSIAYKHVREAAPALTSQRADVPAEYAAIVAQAMAKAPAQRYASAAELRADLHRFLAGQPVSAVDPAVAAAAAAATTVGPAVGRGTTVAHAAAAHTSAPADPAHRRQAALAAAEADRVRSRRSAAVVAAIVVAVALVAAAIAAVVLLRRPAAVTAKAIPPDVVGEPKEVAQGELRGLGFTNVSVQQQTSPTVAADTVMTVDPGAGHVTPLSAPVVLTVSSGAGSALVPDVTNQTLQSATSTLEGAGFTVTTAPPVNSATVPSGDVIASNPAGGTSAVKGTQVTLTLSSGQKTVVIPPLAGTDGTTAANRLGQLGLSVTTRYEASTHVAPGNVTRTSPVAGQTVPVGQTVVLYVSQGTTVPDVRGEPLGAAEAAVSSAGLQSTTAPQAVSSPAQDGVVLAESPPQGTNGATPGQTVTLTVGQYQQPSTTTSAPGSTTTTTGGGGSSSTAATTPGTT